MAKAKPPQSPLEPPAGDNTTATLIVPLADPDPASYIASMSGRINTRLDNGPQLEAFKRVYAGLRDSNALLASGRPVDSAADVLRWLFEHISAQL